MKTKNDYVLRTLAKLTHKRWELYIVSRIIQQIDHNIEFICQQLVKRPDGRRAFSDLFFPQVNIHLEIDEPFHEEQKYNDTLRERDIVETTGHTIRRIKILGQDGNEKRLAVINSEVDNFVEDIVEIVAGQKSLGLFEPWDFDSRYSSKPVIERGYVSVDKNDAFRTQVEVMKCFGFKGRGWMKGAWTIPDGSRDNVWFPRLYPHGIWENELVNNGTRILERATDMDGILSIQKQRDIERKQQKRSHIVFAKSKDALGSNLLRYVGTFQVNEIECPPDCLIFERIASEEAVRS